MKRLLLLLLCSTALFAQSGGQSIAIVIHPSDWLRGPGSSLQQLPDGTFAIVAGYGSSFSKDLGITPDQLQKSPDGSYTKGIYELRFPVVNVLPGYPGYYTAEIYFGTQELCEASGWGMGALQWNGAWGNFYNISFSCHGPAYIVADASLPGGGPVQGKANLVIKFTVNDGSFNGGWPLAFRDVLFSFTPQGLVN